MAEFNSPQHYWRHKAPLHLLRAVQRKREDAMTPQERQLVDDLFDRLSRMEATPRDPDAVAAISQGLRSAPNAVYALVQTVLVQDEALKRANSRIQELEAAGQPAQTQSGGFLDSVRNTITGQSQAQGSVPNVRPPEIPSRSKWNSGQVLQQVEPPGQYDHEPYGQSQGQYGQSQGPYGQSQQGPYGQSQGAYGQSQGSYGQSYGAPQAPIGGGGGSFLGTAAAAAAGMVGGSMLLGGIRSMMGGSHHSFGNVAATGDKAASPKPSSDLSDSQLARDAGINDIGKSAGHADNSSRAGLFDTASKDDDHDDMDLDSDDFDGDSDTA
jgi:hypothetical protein